MMSPRETSLATGELNREPFTVESSTVACFLPAKVAKEIFTVKESRKYDYPFDER